jgi:hypothetical protein
MHEQNPATDTSYALRRAPAETRRLQVQAQILNPCAQQLFEQAGVGVETALQNGASRSYRDPGATDAMKRPAEPEQSEARNDDDRDGRAAGDGCGTDAGCVEP